MLDREKVIRAMECCAVGAECDHCPYTLMNKSGHEGCYQMHADALALLKSLSAFKEYFDGLYGQGLDVANYHLNGAKEPFDSFYDFAMEEYEMPDIEKVVEHIMYCVNTTDGLKNVQWVLVKLDILRDALELLKAKEPVEPVRNKEGVYHCGICGKACVGYEAEYSHSIIKVENYCHKCGRKVKWE